MGDSLNPTVLDRISRLIRPDFTRTVLARRVAAGALVMLAVVAALRPDPGGVPHDVVVAVRDLSPGIELTPDDVALVQRPAAGLPDGAVTTLEAVLGTTLAGPSRRGEVLTDARVLGSRLTGLSAGANARMVPVHLADAEMAELLRPGDVVDVLGTPTAGSAGASGPRVVASAAIVVLVSAKPASGGDDAIVLVALPAAAATALAGATLVQNVTLTIH